MGRGDARGRFGAAALGAAAMTFGAPAAAAELEDEASRLERAWRAAGLAVSRGAPSFLEQGAMHSLAGVAGAADGTGAAGGGAAGGTGAADGAGEACTTVAVLGVRGAEFSVLLPATAAEGRPASRRTERALAGLASVTRCGAERADFARAAVEMRSVRGALEFVVAAGPSPAPAARDALLERSVPQPRPLVDPGRSRSVEGLEARLRWAEERARRDGAAAVERRTLEAGNAHGSGRTLVPLAPGCHRIELFADQPADEAMADVDAELRDAMTNRSLARDRSDTPDAHLDACVAEATVALLRFSGAPGGAALALVDAHRPLPRGLPASAPARARAGMARALAARRVPDPAGPPSTMLLGASGTTYAHLELEPGACYVAAAAVAQGESRALGLSVRGPGVLAGDDAVHGAEGASVAFCAPHPGRAQVAVEARGSGLAWALAVWHVAAVAPGGGAP